MTEPAVSGVAEQPTSSQKLPVPFDEVGVTVVAEGTKSDTRRYTKRQFTWALHQLPDWIWMKPEEALQGILRALGY